MGLLNCEEFCLTIFVAFMIRDTSATHVYIGVSELY